MDRDHLTKAKLTKVVRAVARWKPFAAIHSSEQQDRVEEMEQDLAELMEALGARVRQRTIRQPRKKAVRERKQSAILLISLSDNLGEGVQKSESKKEDLARLRNEQDVSDLIALYDNYFNQEHLEDEPLEDNQSCGIPFAEGDDPENIHTGVEVEVDMSVKDLCSSLDFRNSRPVTFNEYRHLGGATLWDPKEKDLFKDDSPTLAPVKLFWYQLAGVHAIIRKIFNEDPILAFIASMLLADEVGLGKTLQAIAVIAFLADLAHRQRNSMALPPIIGV